MHMVTFTPFRKRNELISKLAKDNPNSVNWEEKVYSCSNDNNMLCKQQYGFRSGKSTSRAIFYVLEIVYNKWNMKLNRLYICGCCMHVRYY